MNPIEKLLEKLKEDDRLNSNGEIKENLLIQLVLQNDEELINRLIEIDDVREEFFIETKFGITFLQDKFLKFLSGKSSWLNSYTRYRNKIGLSNNNELLKDSGKVVIDFPYKDCVLEGGQTKEEVTGDKKEIFYNQVIDKVEIDRLLDVKALQNVKRFTYDGIEEDPIWSDNDNLILKGNNLVALHSIKDVFKGKVKLIYIDPPYNTKQDSFKYNDRFTHSTWLTFMKNRLQIAYKFLRPDGVIMIQIDEKENHYLKVLCDEIFKRENFLTEIVVKTSDPSGHKVVNPAPYSQTEYILMYAKDRSKFKYDIQYVESDYDSQYNRYIENIEDHYSKWKISSLPQVVASFHGYSSADEAKEILTETSFMELVADFALKNRHKVFQLTAISDDAGKDIVALRDKSKENRGQVFHYPREEFEDIYILNGRQIYFYSSKVKEVDGKLVPAKPLTNLWADIPYNGISNEGGVTLKNGKKPEKLLRRIIEMTTNERDIVLDFFLGSGTTCAVAHKMNRKYIGIEQLDYGENDSVVRLQNVINGDRTGISKFVNWQEGGSFVYAELMKYNQLYIEQIMSAKNKDELSYIFEEIIEKGFLNYRVNLDKFNINESEFIELPIERQKEILIDFLDQNQLYVNYSDIDDGQFEISDADRAFMESFYEGGE